MNKQASPLALEDFLPYRLSVLSNTVSHGIARIYKERFGMSVAEWRALAVLGRFAPLSAGDVAVRTAMDKVQVSRAASKLIDNGLVVAAQDKTDRRRTLLQLSAKGKRVHDEIAPLAQAREAALVTALSPAELQELDRLLNKLQARADSLNAPARQKSA